MSILPSVSHVALLGGTYIATGAGSTVTINHGDQGGASSAFKDLSGAAAHTALHDSAARFDAPRCYRNTRAKYLDGLEKWILDEGEDYEGKRLIWLNGGAGAGKSAIMQSIVERCARHSVVLGTFFFSRSDPSRNYAEALIPTLAYQLARAFPAARTVLEPIILRDPLIFKASLPTLAYELLVRPILHLVETGLINTTRTFRGVFVIDGLDECTDPKKQAHIIRVVASILCDHHTPISFLIASRPEVAISHAFQREKHLLPIFASISLNNDVDARSDIRQFLEDGFLDIIESHPWRMHIKLPWPGARSLDDLVWKSSGHFIFAATAMKFIASSDEHPGRALKVVQGLVPSQMGSPFADLDALYTHILTHARYQSQVLEILRHCYLVWLPCSVAAVCYIHKMSPEDVILFLSDVQSLISLTPNSTGELTITPKHASVGDLLKSEWRAGGFYLNQEDYAASFLARYFELVDNGPQTPTSTFSFQTADTDRLISTLTGAIISPRDELLAMSLIYRHSPHNIWNFCVESSALDTTLSSSRVREFIATSVNEYMRAIREFSQWIGDEALYFHQFKLYIDLILDDLDDLVQTKPQYRIIPAILFSSDPSTLYWTSLLLAYWGPRFLIDRSFQFLFRDTVQYVTGKINPWTFEAIRRSPQSKLYWGADLATAMKLVLQQLVKLSRPSNILHTSPHKQWLQRHKPFKRIALGSPRLSSAFFSRFSSWIDPDQMTGLIPHERSKWTPPAESLSKRWHGQKMQKRRMKCLTLLKAVISHLRKSDCTIEVVELARRSLPLAAVWYPKLMKRVRAEMDAYTWRWDVSTKGLLET